METGTAPFDRLTNVGPAAQRRIWWWAALAATIVTIGLITLLIQAGDVPAVMIVCAVIVGWLPVAGAAFMIVDMLESERLRRDRRGWAARRFTKQPSR